MPSEPSYVKIEFISVALVCLGNGVFATLSVLAGYFLVTKRARINWPLLGVLLFMFAVSFAQLVTLLDTTYNAYTQSDTCNNTMGYFAHVSRTSTVVLAALQILTGDAFLVYRVYLIVGNSWHVLLAPLVLLLGNLASAIGVMIMSSRGSAGSAAFFRATRAWLLTETATTLCTNILGTALIAYKMISAQKKVQQLGMRGPGMGGAARSALTVVIESAAIYLLLAFAMLFTSAFAPTAEVIVFNLAPSYIGITFTAIIIRVSLGLSSTDAMTTQQSGSFRQITTIGGTRREVGSGFELSSRARAVEVNVDHLVTVDHDFKKTPSSSNI